MDLKTLISSANENGILTRLGQWVSLSFVLGLGDRDYVITIEKGRLMDIHPRSLPIEAGSFTIRASQAVWDEHWRSMPKPEYHDLFSMLSAGHAQLDGDILPLMQNLIDFKTLLALPRHLNGGSQ